MKGIQYVIIYGKMEYLYQIIGKMNNIKIQRKINTIAMIIINIIIILHML